VWGGGIKRSRCPSSCLFHVLSHVDSWATVTSNGSPYAIGPCLSCLSVLSVCSVAVLWPNGWMHQDVTWYGGRPRPWRHCVRWGPSSLHGKGHSSLLSFSAHVNCGQTVAHLSNCRALVQLQWLLHHLMLEVEPTTVHCFENFLETEKLTSSLSRKRSKSERANITTGSSLVIEVEDTEDSKPKDGRR